MEATRQARPCWIELRLVARFDEETRRFIAGNPRLDVWSSGDTPAHAISKASEAITLFINVTTERGTVWQVLRDAKVECRYYDEPESVSSTFTDWLRSTFFDRTAASATIPFQVPPPSVQHATF